MEEGEKGKKEALVISESGRSSARAASGNCQLPSYPSLYIYLVCVMLKVQM